MANRFFNQFGGTLERKVIKLFAKVDFVAGAPVLVTQEVLNASTSPITVNPSQGIQSISSGGAGRITFVLGANNGGVPTYDPYVRLLNVTNTIVGALTTANVFFTQVTADNVNGATGNPSLEISCFLTGISPAPGFPADGTTLLVEITLSNTTAY